MNLFKSFFSPRIYNPLETTEHNKILTSKVFEGVDLGKRTGVKRIKDLNGEYWFELDEGDDYDLPMYQRTQMFISHLLKGVLPVSEVVCVDRNGEKRFFSKEIKTTSNKKPSLFYNKITFPPERLEMTAEDLILSRIFGDWDHNFMLERHNSIGTCRVTNSVFDFEKAIGFWDTKVDDASNRTNKVVRTLSKNQKEALVYYLDELHKNLVGTKNLNGIEKLCQKILKETGELPEIMKEHTPVEFQEKVLQRINDYKELLTS